METEDLIIVDDTETEDTDQRLYGPFTQITFHSDFASLLVEFYGVIKFLDDSFNAGGLVLQPDFSDDNNAQLTIANYLGILPEQTTDPNLSFVLIRYWKQNCIHKANEISVDEKYFKDFSKISRNDTDNIISLFSKYGSHYVSGYDEGDYIYQIFVYEREIFNQIESEWPVDDPDYSFGYKGVFFRLYTAKYRELPDGTFTGYTNDVGKILAASRDPNLENIRPYLDDDVFGVNSILMFLTDSSIAEMTAEMKTLVLSKIVLRPLSNIIYQTVDNNNKLCDIWKEVLRASVFQKFGKNSNPGFNPVEEKPEISFYDPFNPDFVTRTATSYTAITKAAFNLQDLKILNPDFITHLFIFADVIEVPANAKLSLPGTRSVYIICRELLSNSKGSIVPEIVVGSSNSIPSVKIIAGSLLGTLKLSNRQEHFTFNGGSVFITRPEGEHFIVTTEPTMELKWPLPSIVPEIYSTNSDEYHEEWASRSYINGLQLLAITVESVYSLQASESVETATESLNWMITSLEMAKNETLLSEDLETILSRLLLIKKSKPNSEQPLLLVPTLTFPVYQDLYNAFLDLLKAYEDKLLEILQEISRRLQMEKIVENQDQLNKNILKIGKFLVEMVKADSDYFNDVENMYKNFEQRKIAELELEQEKSKKLFDDVLYYTDEVNKVGEKLAKEVRQAASQAIFQAVVGIAMAIGSMFVGGVGIANIPADVQGIARVAEKVDYCMVLTEQISIIYNLGQDAAGGINSELAKLPDMSAYSSYFPNALDWSDFDADVEMFTSQGYLKCCETTGSDYKNVANKLSSRGKAFLDCQSKVSSLQYEITVNKMMASVAEKQKLRLEELASKFSQEELDDYQTNSTDLFEIGDILQSRANDVRMKLAQTYLTMDAALQYYYMKPPTVLNGYDTLDIQATAAQQIVDSILALESFPSKPHNLNPLPTKDANWRFLITFFNNQRRQMASTDFELQYSKKKEQTMLQVIYIDRTTLCVYVIYSLILLILFFFE